MQDLERDSIWEVREKGIPRNTDILTLGKQENDGAISKTGKSGGKVSLVSSITSSN